MTHLTDGTLADAIETLAKRAADLRTRPRTYVEKQALAGSDFLGSIGSTMRDNPALSGALLGGGVGALAGGISGARDENHPGIFGRALTGGLAGAALGGGAGLAYQGLKGMGHPNAGITGTEALQPGEFMQDGQRMRVDPEALKAEPDLPGRIRALKTPTTPSMVGGSVLAGLGKLHDWAPVTSTMAALGGLGDLALHAPGIGLARVRAENVGGRVGRNLLHAGAEKYKDMSEALRNAILRNKPTGGAMPTEYTHGTDTVIDPGEHIRARGRTDGKGVLDILGGGRATPAKGTDPVLEVTHTPTVEYIENKDGRKFKDTMPKAIKTDRLSGAELGQVKARGLEGSSAWEGRQLYQIPRTRLSYGGVKGWPAALAARAALYGLPMGGEWLLRGMGEDLDKHQQYQQLISRVAKPVK